MDYFPLSLAVGEAFCNRKKELEILSYNLMESRPTLIVSPRRYGKTSLVVNAIAQTHLDYALFDFLSVVVEADIEKILLKGIGQLIGKIEKGPKKALQLATDLFSGLNIKLSLDAIGLSIEINKKSSEEHADRILDILRRVEKLGEKYKKKIVLFFDEFQRICQVSENRATESVLRQVAQASKQLAFVFSGSNRHLLYQIFDDRNRPFYKLCDRITLDRINEEAYISYLKNAYHKKWHKTLDDVIITAIFHHTQRHPYYMNLLCSRLWRLEDLCEHNVHQVWYDYVSEEHSQVALELDLLNASQRKLLVALAKCGGAKELRSADFQLFSVMPGSTIAQAIKFLERLDYVYKDSKGYFKVLDPVFKDSLSER